MLIRHLPLRQNALALFIVFLNSCAGTQLKHLSDTKYPPHKKLIFMVKGTLPSTLEYKRIATIDITKGGYQGEDELLRTMADRAREVGADAVIEIQTARKVTAFSWSSPYGSGVAIKLNEGFEKSINFNKFSYQMY